MSAGGGPAGPVAAALGLTAAAMLAFAANSVLTRLALAPGLIGAEAFAVLRVVSGAATLWAILALGRRAGVGSGARPDPRAAGALALYLVGFTYAYGALDTGVGALILFATVQAVMIGRGLSAGERLPGLGWAGLALALGGLVLLLGPGADAPDPLGAALMVAAGIGWGTYSLIGRGVGDPLGATAWAFALAILPVAAVCLALPAPVPAAAPAGGPAPWPGAPAGIALALASGILASGLGYVIWYAALPRLTATRAAAVQLTVPALAALGGVLLLAEPVTPRLVVASAATLGGVGIVLAVRARR